MRLSYEDRAISDVVCPLCTATTGRILYEITPQESARVFIRPSANQDAYQELTGIIEEVWGTPECRQIRCDQCQSVYAWPHKAGDARFYNLAFREHMRYPQHRWEFNAAMRFVSRDACGPMLEFGAGDGAFVRMLQSAGVSPSSVKVIEYSSAARERLASIDPALGVFSSVDQFLEKVEANSCSHVFAFQVLEHVQQPAELLTAFRRTLRKGGPLCMAVPNPRRVEANELNGLVQDIPPNHVTRFTEKGISALAPRTGFEVVHTEVEPFLYHAWLRNFLALHFHRRLQNEGSIQSLLEIKLPWRLATLAGAVLALPAALSHSFETNEGASLFCVLRAV